MRAASTSRNFVRFGYDLGNSDSLQIRSHEDTKTTIGPYDTGFVIARAGKIVKEIILRKLPKFRHQDSTFARAFDALAVARACGSGGPIYFLTLGYNGDQLSPTLIFTIVPSGEGYIVSTLPWISGGVVEISMADPFRLKAWTNLDEGECNACETAYRIIELEIRKGRPVQIRSYRTRQLYSSVDEIFDDRRRLRFVP
jgi:hypothetical protein